VRILFLFGVALTLSPGLAQNNAGTSAGDFRFEVFSLRPEYMPAGLPTTTAPSPNGFNSRLSLREAIAIAYGISGNGSSQQILKAPEWTDDIYEVRARVQAADIRAWQNQSPDRELLRSALRAALQERCKLAVHEQPSKAPTWDLVARKKSPGLTPVAADEVLPAGKMLASGGVMTSTAIKRNPAKVFHGATMQDLAEFLSDVSRQIPSRATPVRDKTNLPGRYDFTLLQIPTDPRDDRVFNFPLDRLGLKLEMGTESSPILIIDHIEKPAPN